MEPSVNKNVHIHPFFCIMPGVIPIGTVLKALRAQKGISLRKLGKEIGISFNTLNAYERNAIHPTLESSYKMARYFEVPIEYLIHGEKATQEFRDVELLAIFHDVDALSREDRSVIKSYIGKYLKTRTQLDELVEEAQERPKAVEKNPDKKRKKI
jgi:transcriptional regulator with XRE-family HTH domain